MVGRPAATPFPLVRALAEQGRVRLRPHGRRRGSERGFSIQDTVHVLRFGSPVGDARWWDPEAQDPRPAEWRLTVAGTDLDGEPLTLVVAVVVGVVEVVTGF